MKFSVLIFLIFLLPLMESCSSTGSKKADGVSTQKELAENELFSGDVVRQFLEQKVPYMAEANTLFLQALDIYKNKKNASGSIPVFIRSLCKYPGNRSYYELGNACLDAKEYDKAIQCYEMAEKLGYEPFSKVLYNLSCAYSLKKDGDRSAQYLEYSLQAGYSNIDNIGKDKDLAFLREENNWEYKNAIKRGTKGMSNAKTLFWLQFKKPFAKVQLPFVLNGEKREYSEDGYIPYDFEKYISEMRDEKFSREVGRAFYYSTEIASTEKFVALIYAEQDAFLEEDDLPEGIEPIIYRLVTFTPEGKLIDKRIIAGRATFDELVKTARFTQELDIEVKSYELEYTNDPTENGYENNPIKSRKLSGTEQWKINADGSITPVVAI